MTEQREYEYGEIAPATEPREFILPTQTEHYIAVIKTHTGWATYCPPCTIKENIWSPCLVGEWVPPYPPPVLMDPEIINHTNRRIEIARAIAAAYEYAKLPIPYVIAEMAEEAPRGPEYRFAVIAPRHRLPPWEPTEDEQRRLLTIGLTATDITQYDDDSTKAPPPSESGGAGEGATG